MSGIKKWGKKIVEKATGKKKKRGDDTPSPLSTPPVPSRARHSISHPPLPRMSQDEEDVEMHLSATQFEEMMAQRQRKGISIGSGGSSTRLHAPHRHSISTSKAPMTHDDDDDDDDDDDEDNDDSEDVDYSGGRGHGQDDDDDDDDDDDSEDRTRRASTSQQGSRPTPTPEHTTEQDADAEGGGRQASYVWAFFTKTTNEAGGYSIAECNACKSGGKVQRYRINKGGGTGSLIKHLKKHGINKDNWRTGGATSGGLRQTQLSGYAQQMPGGGMPFNYSRDVLVDEFAKFVIRAELPFTHGESEPFEHMVRTALQPQYRKVSGDTLKRHTVKQFKKAKRDLCNMFLAMNGRVSITTDAWSSTVNEPFMCVTAHWIDDDWILQKRIIAFESMYEAHTGDNFKRRLIEVLKTFNLLDKVFSVSVDNATANTKMIEFLIQDSCFPKILKGEFLHVRCAAHVLNLAAQEGLKDLQPLISPLRKVVHMIRAKRSTRNLYKELCARHKLPVRLIGLDCRTRWNSTYTMLDKALKYKKILTEIYNHDVTDPSELITDWHWAYCEKLVHVLKVFYDATNLFSLMYEPNIQLVILQSLEIMLTLDSYLQDTELAYVVSCMKSKWLDYFQEIPPIYTIASILDPINNLTGTRNLLVTYYEHLGITFNVDSYIDHCRKLIEQLFVFYQSIYDPQVQEIRRQTQPIRIGKASTSTSSLHARLGHVIHGSSSLGSSTSELEDYYQFKFFYMDNPDYEVIRWWKGKVEAWPILSRIAKDVLAIPASTIASESAFSAGRRVLDEKRSRLNPESIEICVCKKDWDQAITRTQGLKNLYEDESDDPFMNVSVRTSEATTPDQNLEDID